MKKIITISREFGSGGREIGLKIGEKLGIPVYDKYIIEQVAETTGFDESLVDERLHASPSSSRFASSRRSKINGVSIDDLLYNEESRIIKDFANKGACVFVGRCADYILADRKDTLKIFIYSDPDERMKRIDEVHPDKTQSALKRIQAKDRKRAINYAYFTGREWRNPTNYDLMINSSTFGIEGTADYIIDLYKNSK